MKQEKVIYSGIVESSMLDLVIPPEGVELKDYSEFVIFKPSNTAVEFPERNFWKIAKKFSDKDEELKELDSLTKKLDKDK